MTQNPQNPITKAHLEGVEEFDRTFYYEKGGVQIPKDDISLADVKAFLTTYATNLLNAALEAGPEEKKDADRQYDIYAEQRRLAFNSCRSSFHLAIDEGIKSLKQ